MNINISQTTPHYLALHWAALKIIKHNCVRQSKIKTETSLGDDRGDQKRRGTVEGGGGSTDWPQAQQKSESAAAGSSRTLQATEDRHELQHKSRCPRNVFEKEEPQVPSAMSEPAPKPVSKKKRKKQNRNMKENNLRSRNGSAEVSLGASVGYARLIFNLVNDHTVAIRRDPRPSRRCKHKQKTTQSPTTATAAIGG